MACLNRLATSFDHCCFGSSSVKYSNSRRRWVKARLVIQKVKGKIRAVPVSHCHHVFRASPNLSSSTFDERPAARKQSVKYVVCAIHAQSISCCCSNPTHRSPQRVISSACLPLPSKSQSLVRYALHHAQVGHNGSDVLAKSYLVAPLARLVSSIATSAGAGLLVMAIFSHDRRQRWQIYNLTYIVKLSRYADKSRPHSRQYPLMQSSTTFGFSVIFLLCASCQAAHGFKAALLSQGFCAPNHFGFHLFLGGRSAAVV